MQRSGRCATPAVVAAAVLAIRVPSRVRHSSAIASGPVTETTRRQQPSPGRGSARRRRREESSPPDAVAARFFRPLLMARCRLGRQPPVPKWTGTPPCLRRREDSSPPRRRRGVASAGLGASGQWPVAQPRVAAAEFTAREKGRVPLEPQNPHPRNTRTLRPWANLSAETKPARFASGLWVRPTPKGGSIGLFGYKKRGVRERDEACGTRSQ